MKAWKYFNYIYLFYNLGNNENSHFDIIFVQLRVLIVLEVFAVLYLQYLVETEKVFLSHLIQLVSSQNVTEVLQ